MRLQINKSVIIVYTYNVKDVDDVMRIRKELRELGVIWKIPYKTDRATREGKYEHKGDTKVSTFL